MTFSSINPATGETIEEFSAHTPAQLDQALERAADAYSRHRRSSFAERSQNMMRVADVLEAREEEWARIMTREMGKLLTAAREEVQKCARGCRFYAENAERLLAETNTDLDQARAVIRCQPLGPVLAIMPWNFPFWQVIRFAAPALMAGNVGLLKHAGNVPRCALALEEIFREAGFGSGIFQTLLIDSDQVPRLIEDDRVKAVTLTGSEKAGAAVASAAAKQIKKAVLELGGSDPFIVRPDADLRAAVATGVKSRTINTGQSCIAAKRFIIDATIADRFEQEFVAQMRALRVGDPMEAETELGPLATESILEGVDKQVQASVKAGARLLCGGKRMKRPGFFYEPTVLADIPEGTPARDEEVFGPVAALFRVGDAEEAVRLANKTSFGLGASVWTKDAAEQEFFANEIEAGMVFINGMVASDPRIPFGGIKKSGFGRELGAEGIREFVNVKTIVKA